MTNELKPCPFCGGEAHLEQYQDAPEYFAIVRCSQCDIKAVKDTDEEAIEAWNKRAAYEAEGYFFLPKPKERLFYITPLGVKETENGYAAQAGYRIIEGAVRRWAEEIDDEILRRISECWNTRAERTCETCDYCVYLGEGDFACDERDYEHVIKDWVPLRESCEKWTDG